MYTLVWTSGFTRSARKFLKQHPDLREKFAAILEDLERIIFDPVWNDITGVGNNKFACAENTTSPTEAWLFF